MCKEYLFTIAVNGKQILNCSNLHEDL